MGGVEGSVEGWEVVAGDVITEHFDQEAGVFAQGNGFEFEFTDAAVAELVEVVVHGLGDLGAAFAEGVEDVLGGLVLVVGEDVDAVGVCA